MAWTQYQLVLQLKSPLHIGYRKVGNLMQTRSYVTGKVLWAALTARLTRDLGRGTNGKDYVKIGTLFKNHFRFSYLWPAVSYNGISKVEKWNDLQTLFPFEESKSINPLNLNKIYPHPKLVKSTYFDYCFLDSYTGTALDQYNSTADEGTLHDTEYIAHHMKSDGRPVYLAGSLWVDKSHPPELSDWKDKLDHIRLGGEQSYGWGKVQCICCKPIENQNSDDNVPDPDYFTWCGHVPSHIQVKENGGTVQGIVEPLVGWERQTDNKQEIGRATIALVPGFLNKDETNFAIGEYGVWKEKTTI